MLNMKAQACTFPFGVTQMIEVLISKEKIAARVKEIGAEIARDFAGLPIVMLCTLMGGVTFMADLAREIDLDIEMEFIKVSSYGNNSQPDGTIKLDYPVKLDLNGKHVILVEDIVDMGYTAKWLLAFLQEMQPASVKLCTLLDKPDRRKVQGVKIDYLGFSIPDEFVVGYGLDYAQKYRNLPYVGKLEVK
jgi:hypoxanthine phosphoribosyltransferase